MPSELDSVLPAMRPNPQRVYQLTSNLASVQHRIATVASRSNIEKPIRLVAVSKLKPATDILALYSSPSPHLHFGENYVQELVKKSRLLPQEIRWHFIGGLQSNKAQALAREVKGLWAVESVDSVKKAKLLDKGRGELRSEGVSTSYEPLRVFVQINTSGEESKSGLQPDSRELVELCKFIRDECPNLTLQGLMTIGAIARSWATTEGNENEDFIHLKTTRDAVAGELGLKSDTLELSMGMSEDFEGAIVMGTDEVRIGRTIFGERSPKSETKVLEGNLEA